MEEDSSITYGDVKPTGSSIEDKGDQIHDLWLPQHGIQITEEDCEEIEEIDKSGDDFDKIEVEGEVEKISECFENMTPCLGMEFSSEKDAYDFYNQYARRQGFGIRKAHFYRSRKTNCITCRKFVCSKEGKIDMNDKRKMGREVKRRRETREDCKAYMRIRLSKCGVWKVDDFMDIHSHNFSTPTKVAKLRSHSRLSESCKNMIDSLHETGMRPSAISKVLIATSNGVDIDRVTRQSCISHLKSTRKNDVGRQCLSVIKYFQEKNVKDSDFFFEIELDENGTTQNVFWADGRSRASYMNFGDVIVFDVTYKTNAFSMPFAPFTGINHHRQSTLFGCALLADETEATFTWLFKTWLKCMWGKAPTSIITDQDGAMRKAIATVFSKSHHRFCSWHISNNAMIHLKHLKSNHSEFEKEYNDWIYRSDTTAEFEEKWKIIKEKYNSDKNSWLSSMYDVRHHWISIYMKDKFFAGMTSSQRSESMNSFFDGFVHSQTPLADFVRQYDRALQSRRFDEEQEDFKTLNSKPVLCGYSPLEAEAGTMYTRSNFEIFKDQLKRSQGCICRKIGEESSITKYEVFPHDDDAKRHVVAYQSCGQMNVTCSCKKFESEGILCMHILKIFHKRQFCKIPSQYVLHRWTIKARYCYSSRREDTNLVHSSRSPLTPLQIWRFRNMTIRLQDLGTSSDERYYFALPLLENLVEQLDTIGSSSSLRVETSNESFERQVAPSMEHIPQIVVRDPSQLRTKGRPKNSQRLKAGYEVAQAQTKKWMCSLCNERGHYSTTCKNIHSNCNNDSIQ